MIYILAYFLFTALILACLSAAMAGFGVSLSLEIKEWWRNHHAPGNKKLLPH